MCCQMFSTGFGSGHLGGSGTSVMLEGTISLSGTCHAAWSRMRTFPHTMPPVEQRFVISRAVSDAGVRRYDFHGLSYEYISSRLPAVSLRLAEGRTIIVHLGGLAPVCVRCAGRDDHPR